MEKKMHSHGVQRIFYDILRDTNNAKYSMTKFAGLVGIIALFATIVMSLIIMWQKKVIDYVLVGEIIGFVLTLLGFKNSFGLNGKNGQTPPTENIDVDPDAGKQLMGVAKPDDVDDSLKG